MKITNLVLAALFAVFALVQLNDVDPFLWVTYYGLIALICGLAAWGRRYTWLLAGVALFGLIHLGLILPEFINWVSMGMPSITEKMKAEAPHIEYAREFLGLLLGLAVVAWQWKKKSSSGKQ